MRNASIVIVAHGRSPPVPVRQRVGSYSVLAMATGGAGGGKVKNIVNDAQFQKELIAAGEKLVVTNFSANRYLQQCSSYRIEPLMYIHCTARLETSRENKLAKTWLTGHSHFGVISVTSLVSNQFLQI